MEICIKKLTERDAEELFKFEFENRTFFEKSVPTRGDNYYQFDNFKESLKNLLMEQEKGESTFYLIRNCHGQIVGRINLVDLDLSTGTAHLGYRVGENYAGKGIANKALKLLLESLNGTEVKEINAKTTMSNIPSRKVLEKNNFVALEQQDEWVEINGEKLDFVHYTWQNPQQIQSKVC